MTKEVEVKPGEAIFVVAFMIAVVLISFVIGLGVGISSSIGSGRTAAIKHGAAKYVSDKWGRTKFVWNDEQNRRD